MRFAFPILGMRYSSGSQPSTLAARWRGALLVAVLAALTLGSSGDASAARPNDWGLRASTPKPAQQELRAGQTFRLVNKTNGKAVVSGSREYGINLVWGKASGPNSAFFAFRAGAVPSDAVVRYGDKVSLAITGRDDVGHGHLRYKERKYGINLVYSKERELEWELRGGAIGSPVRWGDTIGLWNSRIRRFMVHGERSFGINLVWYGSGGAPANADVAHSVRFGPYTEPLPQGCSGTVTWNFAPVRLTGSGGRTTAHTFSQQFAVPTQLAGPREYYCNVYANTGGLRVGRWRVQAQAGTWTASCERDLKAGNNLAIFTFTKAGCSG